MASDIEVMLADTAGKDVNEASASTESSAEKTVDDKSAKELERLKKVLAQREASEAKLKAEVEELRKPKQEVQKVDESDELATREGWLKKMDQIAEEKANASFSKIREANLKRARDRFISQHPEYATDSVKLRSVLERATLLGLSSVVDESEMMEKLQDSWAVENRKELESLSVEREKSRARSQKVALQAASASGSSEKAEDDFSEEEKDRAATKGWSPERLRRAEKMLSENSSDL